MICRVFSLTWAYVCQTRAQRHNICKVFHDVFSFSFSSLVYNPRLKPKIDEKSLKRNRKKQYSNNNSNSSRNLHIIIIIIIIKICSQQFIQKSTKKRQSMVEVLKQSVTEGFVEQVSFQPGVEEEKSYG